MAGDKCMRQNACFMYIYVNLSGFKLCAYGFVLSLDTF